MPRSAVIEKFLRVVPARAISRVAGKLAQRPADALLEKSIDAYCKAYDIDLDDYVVPGDGFANFNAFFARALKPGKRPIADAFAVAPTDARIADVGPISETGEFFAKGSRYSVDTLLGGGLAGVNARAFAGGSFVVHYLSPRDYHRVHAAVSGEVLAYRHIRGAYFPVNALGTDNVPGLFQENERVVVVQQTQHGKVATVLVGAMVVGGIELTFASGLQPQVVYNSARPQLGRGDELGRFLLGSTVVMLLPPVTVKVAAGDFARMGQALATVTGASSSERVG